VFRLVKIKCLRRHVTISGSAVKIAEDYGTFEAPVWFLHVVERLLASVPPGQLHGLSSVAFFRHCAGSHRLLGP